MNTRNVAVFALLFLNLNMTGFAASVGQSDQPVLLKADHLSYDHQKNLVIAKGNVEAYQEKDVLIADEISYDRRADKITATGNVIWQKESGDVFFGSFIELEDRLKEGLIKEFKGHLADNAKLAANQGHRHLGTQTRLDQAVYSPCKVCKGDSKRPPLWQLKAESVLWDEEVHDIIYTDARMEFFGVPVFYTPYMRHPDPSVKQRSGILAPSLNSSNDLGPYFSLPYYYVISPDKDLTLVPLITSKKGQFLSGEYRQTFAAAKFLLGGSLGKSNKLKQGREHSAVRGHVDSKLSWDINDYWRLKANVLRASDATYFRQFPFYGNTRESVLTSQAKAEGFYGLSYVRLQGMSYQGLRSTDRQKTIPIVAPSVDYNYVSMPQIWGSRFLVDANTLVITRKQGGNVQRLSAAFTWKLPFTSVLGDRYTLSTKLRGDAYNVRNYPQNLPLRRINGGAGRILPEFFLEWEYPWIKKLQDGHVTLSPLASVVVAPRIKNQNKVPNEDCVDIEPNDLFILGDSRYPGLDRLDDGSRFNYGLKLNTRVSKNIKARAFVGQSVRLSGNPGALRGTGFERKVSDYMGRVYVSLYDYVELGYRFRVDKSRFKTIRDEFSASAGVPVFKVNLAYLKLPRFFNDPLNQTGNQQLSAGISSTFAKGWKATLSAIRELGARKGSLSHVAGIEYENECIAAGLQLRQNYFRDREIKQGKGFMFVLSFKNLGGQTLSAIKWKQQFDQVYGGDSDSSIFDNSNEPFVGKP